MLVLYSTTNLWILNELLPAVSSSPLSPPSISGF
jgi:hypothetical protein